VCAAQVERQGDAAITTVLLRLAREATKPGVGSPRQLTATRADSRFKRLAALVAATVWRMAPRELATTLYAYALLNHTLDVSLQVLRLSACRRVACTHSSWSYHRHREEWDDLKKPDLQTFCDIEIASLGLHRVSITISANRLQMVPPFARTMLHNASGTGS